MITNKDIEMKNLVYSLRDRIGTIFRRKQFLTL